MSALRLTEEQFAAAQTRARKPATRAQTPAPSPTHTKYRNRPTGGYASVKEARRAAALKLLLAAGDIAELREQVKFILIPALKDSAGKLIERECSYYADFQYMEVTRLSVLHGQERIVEDCKGYRNKKSGAYALYSIKRKLMLHVHGIAIRET